MLRSALLVLSVIMIAAPLFAPVEAMIPAVAGVMLLLALLFERFIYKPIRSERPGPGWERTTERFADPETGRDVTVYYHPRTGERRYVADDDRA